MELVEVHSALDHHNFRAGIGIGLEQLPNWFDRFDEGLRTSRWFHPYLQRTSHRRWLVREKGHTSGRIMAMHPRSGPGRFGFFNCIDNPQAVQMLTQAAETWLHQRGAERLIGPFNPSIHDECGLLEQTKQRVGYGYPQTPQHYINNLEACGYHHSKRLLTFCQNDPQSAMRLQQRMAPLLGAMPNQGLRLEVAQWSTFRRHSAWVEALINQCWGNNWGFEPLGKAEARQLLIKVLTFLPPGVLSFVSLHGRPAAICLGIPDAREIAAKLPPRLGLLNLPRLVLGLRLCQCEHVRIALLGMIPDLQGSQLGLTACVAMLSHLVNKGLAFGSSSASMGWILEDNQAMLRFLKLYGGELVMSHLIMGKTL